MKIKLETKPYKGSRDFYPEDMQKEEYIFNTWRKVCKRYGYEEYMGPFLESTLIYEAKSGEEIVGKELYSFEDKGGRKVAIRPEMTPTLARMIAGRFMELPRPIRWFSIPNLWRYEKPQRGRLREHYQLNVDIFGVEGIEADFEIINLLIDIMKEFGADNSKFEIRIGNRRLLQDVYEEFNIPESSQLRVSKAIDKYLKLERSDFIGLLEDDAKLDKSQIEALLRFLENPTDLLAEFVNRGSQGAEEMQSLLTLIKNNGLDAYVTYDPAVVRGLDYYTGNVFELFDKQKDNNRAMLGGGRYDNLVEIFNGQKLTGIGFGSGDVTMKLFLESWGLMPEFKSEAQLYVTLFDESLKAETLNIAQQIRNAGINVVSELNSKKMAKQFKFADAKKIPYVLVVGSDELQKGVVQLKNMQTGEQKEMDIEGVIDYLKK